MLQKLIALKNIGLFKDGLPKALDLSQLCLIYAENGRGKTTLCSVLRSCAENDPRIMEVRTTVDATDKPKAVFRLADGTTALNVEFENGKWSSPAPQILIFDSEFVERNVYTGQEVRSAHKQQLLDFALGADAVQLKEQTSALATAQAASTRERTSAEDSLKGYRGQTPLPDFLALPEIPDADEQIARLETRIRDAQAIKEIAARKILMEISHPGIDIDAVRQLLHTELKGVQADAEQAVRLHFAAHGEQGLERWVADGQRFVQTGDICPFCAQPLSGSKLIAAYQAYFSQQYSELKAHVATLRDRVASAFTSRAYDTVVQLCASNEERFELWRAHVAAACPALDTSEFAKELESVEATSLALLNRKFDAPLDRIGTDEEIAHARKALAALYHRLDEYNASVKLVNTKIAEYKDKLKGEDVQALEAQLGQVRLQKTRHSPDVLALVTAYKDADKRRTDFEAEKNATRLKLNALMEQRLTEYGAAINDWLSKFGATFTVEKLKPFYSTTGSATSDYAIRIRNKVVPVGQRVEGELGFSSVLSEGDKRTLAFAFYLARLFVRVDRAKVIAVMDDPFASLDRHRRAQTQAAVIRATRECKQVILLAHDAFFLRDVRDDAVKKGLGSPRILQISYAPGDYSCVELGDLDKHCISPYARNYRRVRDFLNSENGADARSAAEALRPLVESHLHRRFLGMLNGGQTLGKVLDTIKSAPATSPLTKLQSQVSELADFNDYAGRYHHDTNENATSEPVNEAELRVYAKRALSLIQTGQIQADASAHF